MLKNLPFGHKEKIILIVFAVLLILTPVTVYVASLATNLRSSASTGPQTGQYVPVSSPREVPKDDPFAELKKAINATPSATPIDTAGLVDVTPTSTESATLLLGQTLGFKIKVEGRPDGSQAAKVFVGIGAGEPVNNPTYLLSFLVNVANSGVYTGLPLNGLDLQQRYTAYIKGPAQLATASAFTVTPTPMDLGFLNLITGDVNEDNVIDANDYNIVKSNLGLTSSSQNWNSNLDFNLDGRINTLDLSIVQRNLGKTGMSGPWYSSLQQATKSATVSGGPDSSNPIESQPPSPQGKNGYWLWMPTEF